MDSQSTRAEIGRGLKWQKELKAIWQETPGLSVSQLQSELQKRFADTDDGDVLPSKNQVKFARETFPYRPSQPPINSQVENDNAAVARFELQIEQLLHMRSNFRSTKRTQQLIAQADDILLRLKETGIVVDDRLRTWTPTEPFSKEILSTVQKLHESYPGVPCQFCCCWFGSRNLVFEHLRNPDSPCGAAIVASGQSLHQPPSNVKKQKALNEKLQKVRRRPTGSTAKHAAAEQSLWIGHLPLPWTKPQDGKHKRLQALLYAHLPPTVPHPWIKTVIRKAYKRPLYCNTGSGHDKDVYHGYAIVVFRDAEEARMVLSALNTKVLSFDNVYSREQLQGNRGLMALSQEAPILKVKVRPALGSEMVAAGSRRGGNNDDSCTNRSSSSTATKKALDPPLLEQLKPLTVPELCHRHERMRARYGNHGQEQNEVEDDDHTAGSSQDALASQSHSNVLHQLVQMYSNYMPKRPEHSLHGRLIPNEYSHRLLELLSTLRWPAQNQRAGLSAERYLVLTTTTTRSTTATTENNNNSSSSTHNDQSYAALRQACADLMNWTDPDYFYSGIAVTKNFVASPHIDDRDTSFQYAVSFMTYTTTATTTSSGMELNVGGELCVEGEDLEGQEVVYVVNTRNRMARVDGRRVHWVRQWRNNNNNNSAMIDRYSLIFYNTTDRFQTPVLRHGVDLEFLEND